MTTSLHQFRLASIAHLDAATTLLAGDDENAAARRPSSAGYLASVSLECVLKARLLFRGGFASDDKLKEKQPAVYEALFKGAKGHDVGKLSEQLRLREFLNTEGKTLKQDAIWKRLTRPARPYSLRYGTEHLSKQEAADEVARVNELHGPLLAGLNLAMKQHKKRTPTP